MAEDQDVIRVRVGIFSGRENPVVTLDGEAQTRFTELMRSIIGKERSHAPGPPKLGEFHGFLVNVPAAISEEGSFPKTIEVRSGVVSVISSGEGEHWLDVAGLENFLIGLAYHQGQGDLLERLGIQQGQKN